VNVYIHVDAGDVDLVGFGSVIASASVFVRHEFEITNQL